MLQHGPEQFPLPLEWGFGDDHNQPRMDAFMTVTRQKVGAVISAPSSNRVKSHQYVIIPP